MYNNDDKEMTQDSFHSHFHTVYYFMMVHVEMYNVLNTILAQYYSNHDIITFHLLLKSEYFLWFWQIAFSTSSNISTQLRRYLFLVSFFPVFACKYVSLQVLWL